MDSRPSRPPSWARARRAVGRRRDLLGVIAIGGALGSLGRWALAEALPHQRGTFAWSTFITNVSGCLLIGLLMVFVIEVWPPSRYVRPFLAVGILGGYTTFSTFMLDERSMLVAGNTGAAGVYLFGSVVAGLCAVWLAVLAARGLVRLSRRRRDRSWDRHAGESPHAPAVLDAEVSDHGQASRAEPSTPARSASLQRTDREPRRTR